MQARALLLLLSVAFLLSVTALSTAHAQSQSQFSIPSGDAWFDLSAGNFGIYTTAPSYSLSFGGDAARIIGLERMSTAGAGNTLSVLAGGAHAGDTDANGGNVLLTSGIATGNGSSSILFQTVVAGQGTGTTDRAPATSMTLASNALTIPTGTTAQQPGQSGMQAAAVGMMRYNTTTNKFEGYQNGTWTNMIAGGGTLAIDDLLDASADYATDHNLFMGSGAGTGIQSGGQNNVFIGENAGHATTTGDENVAIGPNALDVNTTGSNNIAVGLDALGATTTGSVNVAIGAQALYTNTTGTANTAVGVSTLRTNTTANDNTVVGYQAMYFNTTGAADTAIGSVALKANTIGTANTAVGYQALRANTTAHYNSAFGYNALAANTTGTGSVAVGKDALLLATTGSNTAVGYQAGNSITTGTGNILIGYDVDTPAAATNNWLNIGDTIYADLSSDKVGIGTGTTTPSYDLSLYGTGANKTIGMERETTAATAGRGLTLLAGGAKSGGTNLDGGSLTLTSGTATGNGSSSILFQTVVAGQGTGTTDRSPATSMTLASNALTIPTGASTQEPGQSGMQSAANGMIRYDTTTHKFRGYQNGAWTDMIGGGGSTSLDAITAAVANQSGLANGAYTIVWNWDSLAGGTALKLASTSTAAASNAQKMFEIALSGTNGTSAQTTYGAYITNTHDGTTSTNVGLYASASGGTSANYAAVFPSGYVGVGTATPTAAVDVVNGQIVSRRYALSDGATIAVDWHNGNVQSVTLGGNRTLTFSNPIDGARYVLIIKQDGTGSRTVTWPATVRWPGGTAPTLTTTASKTDYIAFIYNGVDSKYDGIAVSQNY
jgi:hypothetical protein